MTDAAAITIGEISPEQNWAVITILVGMLVAAVGAIIRGLLGRLGDKQAAIDERDREIEQLEDQQAKERHAAILAGIEAMKVETVGVKTEVRGLKHEVHQLRRDHDELRPRVERIEKAIKPEGRD